MKDPQNLTIVLLLITAVTLSAMLITAYRDRDDAAYAAAPAIKGGDYLIAPGAVSASTDAVYVLDIGAQRLNMYFTNPNARSLDMADSIDLSRAFQE